MSIIKLLNEFDETTELPPTQANFPALEHYFPCTEISGTTLTDSVSGVKMAVDSLSGDGNKMTTVDAANNTLAEGNWVAVGSNTVVIVVFTDSMYDALIEIGSSDGGSDTGFGSSASGAAFKVGANGVTTSSIAPGMALEAAGIAAVYIHNTTLTEHGSLASDLSYDLDPTPGNAAGVSFLADPLPNSSKMVVVGLYGLLIFHFDTLPGDIKQAIQWMTNQWINNGNKSIYPGWKGRS